MASKVFAEDDEVIAEINIVPFVDIVLVLLIAFMLTSSAIARASISVELPTAASGGAAVASTLNIVLDAKGTLYLDGTEITPKKLGAHVARASWKEKDLQVVISADKSVDYGHVVNVLDVVKSNGVKSFALNIQREFYSMLGSPHKYVGELPKSYPPLPPRVRVSRQLKRQEARERIHARVTHPIDTPRLLRDPLERRESSALSALASVRLLIGAVVIHGVVIVGFATVNQVMGGREDFRPPERLKVNIVDIPPPVKPPPPVEEPVPVEGAIEPEFTPPPPSKPEPAPKPVPKTQVPTPAPAPQELPQETEPVPRRIVGLSLESTVQGDGPAFATGTTRMGRTEQVAEEPRRAAKAPAASGPSTAPVAGPPANVQRAATRIPTRDVTFEKPRRLRPKKPTYPAILKAQGVEGTVGVSVDLAASGKVIAVRIVTSSGHALMDQEARNAALAESFSPAKREGHAEPFTINYSYIFRIED